MPRVGLAVGRYQRARRMSVEWKIDAKYMIAKPGQVFRGVTVYTMGVNRNRQWDEEMYIYWGPHEVVDGSRYPNPWDLPGQ
jgi:hypothetical protein